MTKVAAFVVHLPRLSAMQVATVLDWTERRCVDPRIVTGAHGKDDIYAVLLEARDERNLKNLLCTNFKNWDIKKTTYQRGWFEGLTVQIENVLYQTKFFQMFKIYFFSNLLI